MAKVETPPADEPGAPIPKDKIDEDLVKLSRTRPKVGVITAAGLVFLSALFLYRLGADRRFSGSDAAPEKTTLAAILAGDVALDRYISVDAEPLLAHALRSVTSKGNLGLRVVPARGTGDRVWLVLSGDGWEMPLQSGYVGRLRRLADLPLAPSITEYAETHPRPVFATAAAVRAGVATGSVKTVSGDVMTIHDGARVAFDVVDPEAAVIVAAFNARIPNVVEWTKALAKAGITPTGAPTSNEDQVRFTVAMPGAVAALTSKLEAADLWAARVDPVTRHYETTWAVIRAAPPTGFIVETTTIPDAQLDLIGLYVARTIPADAYAVITGERPEDYWYVLPVTIALAAIGLVFAWALVRAVRRDLMPATSPREPA
jgi:hypothetical protein